MLILIILIIATVLVGVWLLMLMAVSRADWNAAIKNKLVDNSIQEDELLRKDAANAAILAQYHGIAHGFLKIFIGGSSKKEIAKLHKQNQALERGKPVGINIVEMPGYSMQRIFPFIGSALRRNLFEKCSELYGKTNGISKAAQITAQTVSYLVIGCALSLLLGSIAYLASDSPSGFMLMAMLIVVTLVVSRSFPNQINENLKKRRDAITRQFPNAVSKMALLTTSGMSVRQAWRETAESQELQLYQEMRRTADELDSNVFPAEAYTHFINRCNTKETTKLASAILQSLSRSNDEISTLLRSLSHDAWQERQHNARRDAENAKSKLMIPTFMLFIGIMIMIIAPVVMSIGGM